MAEIAIVMAVIAGLNLCLKTFQEFNEFRKERKNSKAANALDKGLDQELEYTRKRIVKEKTGLEKWIVFTENRSDKQPAVSASFKSDIKHRLDHIIKQEESFKKDMEQLRKLLERDDESSLPQIKKLSTLIKMKTRKIKDLATTQYKQMAIGLWNLEALAELPNHKSRQFCPGALRLQNHKLPNVQIVDIAVDYNTKEKEFICRYCSLQVGNEQSAAESHLIGSAAFGDFKAFYKCLPCYMAHDEKDFGSVDILRAHILSVHSDVDMQTWKTRVSKEEDPEEEELFETGELAMELAEFGIANSSFEMESNDRPSDENDSDASLNGNELDGDKTLESSFIDQGGIDDSINDEDATEDETRRSSSFANSSHHGGSEYSVKLPSPNTLLPPTRDAPMRGRYKRSVLELLKRGSKANTYDIE